MRMTFKRNKKTVGFIHPIHTYACRVVSCALTACMYMHDGGVMRAHGI
jgi:hypothetical protein